MNINSFHPKTKKTHKVKQRRNGRSRSVRHVRKNYGTVRSISTAAQRRGVAYSSWKPPKYTPIVLTFKELEKMVSQVGAELFLRNGAYEVCSANQILMFDSLKAVLSDLRNRVN